MSAQERIAAVLREHVWYFVGNLGVPGMEDSKDYKCACGWLAGGGIGVGEDPNAHVAAAVLAALELTEPKRPDGAYLPLYGEKRCAKCDHWRGEHLLPPFGNAGTDADMHCPCPYGLTFMPAEEQP